MALRTGNYLWSLLTPWKKQARQGASSCKRRGDEPSFLIFVVSSAIISAVWMHLEKGKGGGGGVEGQGVEAGA